MTGTVRRYFTYLHLRLHIESATSCTLLRQMKLAVIR